MIFCVIVIHNEDFDRTILFFEPPDAPLQKLETKKCKFIRVETGDEGGGEKRRE